MLKLINCQNTNVSTIIKHNHIVNNLNINSFITSNHIVDDFISFHYCQQFGDVHKFIIKALDIYIGCFNLYDYTSYINFYFEPDETVQLNANFTKSQIVKYLENNS